MREENAIEVKNITKTFKVYLDKGSTLKEKLLFTRRRRYEERKVLDGVSFDVKKGEAVGLIGHNGCGKSTTLKLLTRIMYPDSGTIEMKGRVSSLIELGAGFHPDMSGRENIFINASIFGLTRKEIDKRLDDIIAFSELEEFIDNPVRTYSSGMYMRLAFAVAINVDADILLIDEILAVGDASFQSKCFNRLREIKASGVTIVLVSHDTGTVERFCDRAAWINDGKIMIYGSSIKTVDEYLSYMNEKRIESIQKEEEKHNEERIQNKQEEQEEISEKESTNNGLENEAKETIDYNSNHFGLGYVKITDAFIKDSNGKITTALREGYDYTIEIHYSIKKRLSGYIFGMGIYTMDKTVLVGNNTQLDNIVIRECKPQGVVKCKMHNLPLLTGKYILNVAVVDENNTPMDFYRDYLHFDVISNDRSTGYISLKHDWIIDGGI